MLEGSISIVFWAVASHKEGFYDFLENFFSKTQKILEKLKKFLKILNNFGEKLKKSWKYSIFGKSIYPGYLK